MLNAQMLLLNTFLLITECCLKILVLRPPDDDCRDRRSSVALDLITLLLD